MTRARKLASNASRRAGPDSEPSEPSTALPATMAAAAPVGFIGLGIMGLGQARNLLRSGRSLVVWNRSVEKSEAFAAEELAAGKVTVAASAAEVVEKCSLTYSMLSTLEASHAVFPSVLERVSAGKSIVDCATLTPERMAEMSAAVKGAGGSFLEAPVSGSKGPAEQGALIFLTAGDEAVKEAATADFDAMGKATFYFGEEVGRGSKMKLVVNMIMGIQLNALAEGVALTEASDLPVDDLLKILSLGAMNSPMINLKGPGMAKRSYDPPQFPLKHAQKDMRFALALADDLGKGLPVAAASNEVYKRARTEHGESDFAAVAEASRS